MRPSLRVARAVAAACGAGVLLAYAFSGTSVADDQTIQANGQNQFAPANVTVDPGDTVTWQYAGGFGHTVTSTSANWSKDTALGPPAPTLQTSYLFDRPGTYTFVCKTHESVGMRGSVTVTGRTPTPRPTTTRPTVRPTATPTSGPTASPTASVTPSASASASSASPPVIPSGSVPPASPTPSAPLPSVAPSESPSGAPFLGEGGLTPMPPTGRAKGLPVMLALLLIGGIGSAEIRALLANAPE